MGTRTRSTTLQFFIIFKKSSYTSSHVINDVVLQLLVLKLHIRNLKPYLCLSHNTISIEQDRLIDVKYNLPDFSRG